MTAKDKNYTIPNSFQTPNIMVDAIGPYLTDPEVRVLQYATRHILGWHEKIEARKGTISLHMFENGYGPYPGCGLSKPAIMKALKYLDGVHIMGKDGPVTKNGQRWQILESISEVDWPILEKRLEIKQSKNKKRTENMLEGLRQKRAQLLSDLPEVVSETNQERLVALTESNPLPNPPSNPKDSCTPESGAQKIIVSKSDCIHYGRCTSDYRTLSPNQHNNGGCSTCGWYAFDKGTPGAQNADGKMAMYKRIVSQTDVTKSYLLCEERCMLCEKSGDRSSYPCGSEVICSTCYSDIHEIVVKAQNADGDNGHDARCCICQNVLIKPKSAGPFYVCDPGVCDDCNDWLETLHHDTGKCSNCENTVEADHTICMDCKHGHDGSKCAYCCETHWDSISSIQFKVRLCSDCLGELQKMWRDPSGWSKSTAHEIADNCVNNRNGKKCDLAADTVLACLECALEEHMQNGDGDNGHEEFPDCADDTIFPGDKPIVADLVAATPKMTVTEADTALFGDSVAIQATGPDFSKTAVEPKAATPKRKKAKAKKKAHPLYAEMKASIIAAFDVNTEHMDAGDHKRIGKEANALLGKGAKPFMVKHLYSWLDKKFDTFGYNTLAKWYAPFRADSNMPDEQTKQTEPPATDNSDSELPPVNQDVLDSLAALTKKMDMGQFKDENYDE